MTVDRDQSFLFSFVGFLVHVKRHVRSICRRGGEISKKNKKKLVGLQELVETYNARGPLITFEILASVSIRSLEKHFLYFRGAEGRFDNAHNE